jgi:hypothetical protein
MDRGRGSADQRNQATISHELQKYSRSRTGKGMNSREVAGRLDPCRVDRDVAGGQRAGAEARRRRAGAEAPRRELTGGRWTPGSMSRGQRRCLRPASRGGGSSPVAGEQDEASPRVFAGGGAKCGSAGVEGWRWDRGRECASVCWAGPYRMGRYVSADVLNIHEINKKSDTLQIRTHHVSDAYPYRTRIRYGIRHLPGVSMLHRLTQPI